jgi:single-strand DNA-binding protein
MNQNVVNLVGRLAANPIVKSYNRKSDGKAGTRCFMRLAVTRMQDRAKKIGDPLRRTNFVPLVAWGKRAELCAQYLAQGTMISVRGEVIAESQLITDNGQKDGTPVLDGNGKRQYRDFFYIQCEDVQFGPRSLKNATPEQRQRELERVQAAINGAADGGSPATGSPEPAPSIPADDANPYGEGAEGAEAAA